MRALHVLRRHARSATDDKNTAKAEEKNRRGHAFVIHAPIMILIHRLRGRCRERLKSGKAAKHSTQGTQKNEANDVNLFE